MGDAADDAERRADQEREEEGLALVSPLRREHRTYVVHLIESYKIRATTEENAVAQAECGLFDPDTIDVQVEVLKED